VRCPACLGGFCSKNDCQSRRWSSVSIRRRLLSRRESPPGDACPERAGGFHCRKLSVCESVCLSKQEQFFWQPPRTQFINTCETALTRNFKGHKYVCFAPVRCTFWDILLAVKRSGGDLIVRSSPRRPRSEKCKAEQREMPNIRYRIRDRGPAGVTRCSDARGNRHVAECRTLDADTELDDRGPTTGERS
jgi:hypothetical protein